MSYSQHLQDFVAVLQRQDPQWQFNPSDETRQQNQGPTQANQRPPAVNLESNRPQSHEETQHATEKTRPREETQQSPDGTQRIKRKLTFDSQSPRRSKQNKPACKIYMEQTEGRLNSREADSDPYNSLDIRPVAPTWLATMTDRAIRQLRHDQPDQAHNVLTTWKHHMMAAIRIYGDVPQLQTIYQHAYKTISESLENRA